MRLLTRHPLITFGWMLLSAMVFGLCSYNLFSLLKADIDLIVDYGVHGADGRCVQATGDVVYVRCYQPLRLSDF